MKSSFDSISNSSVAECGQLDGIRFLGVAVALTLIAAVVSSFFLPWTQTVGGAGRVIALSPVDRETPIRAPVDGRVLKWLVHEGDAVEEGQPLAELEDNDPEILDRLTRSRDAATAEHTALETAVSVAERHIEALEAARDAALYNAELSVKIANEYLESSKQKLIAAEAKAKTAQINLKRQRSLNERGLTSDRELELAELAERTANSELDQARASLRAAEHSVEASEAKMGEIQEGNRAKIKKALSEMEKMRAEANKAIAKVAQEDTKLSRQQQMVVRAPKAGRILAIDAREGSDFIKAGTELGRLVPDTMERAVEVVVDGNDAPLVQEGRKVRLQFEGWPAVQFAGWPSVAVGTFGGQVAFMDYAARPDGSFRVVIVPDPDDDPWPEGTYLRQGARARAWLLLNRVSVAYELWRELNGFPVMAEAPPKRVKIKARK